MIRQYCDYCIRVAECSIKVSQSSCKILSGGVVSLVEGTIVVMYMRSNVKQDVQNTTYRLR